MEIYKNCCTKNLSKLVKLTVLHVTSKPPSWYRQFQLLLGWVVAGCEYVVWRNAGILSGWGWGCVRLLSWGWMVEAGHGRGQWRGRDGLLSVPRSTQWPGCCHHTVTSPPQQQCPLHQLGPDQGPVTSGGRGAEGDEPRLLCVWSVVSSEHQNTGTLTWFVFSTGLLQSLSPPPL